MHILLIYSLRPILRGSYVATIIGLSKKYDTVFEVIAIIRFS